MLYFNKIWMCAIISLLLASVSWQANAETETPIRFGSVAMDIPAVMHKRLTPLTHYISETLGRPVVLKLSPDMPSAIEAVARGEVDLAYLTPVAYLNSREKGQTRLIVKTLTNNKPYFKLMIVVREDSPIQRVEDLVGTRFAFGDRAAILQRAAVVASGIKLEQLGSYEFIGHYDNIVRGVMNRDFDAGILKDTKAYMWHNKGIRILYSSPELPPYNITARNGLDEKTFNALRDAFLQLDKDNPEQKRVIETLSKQYDGFVPANDADYDIVRELVAPFRQ